MAVRFEMNPPARADGNALVTWTCGECKDSKVKNPHDHAQRRHNTKERAVILEKRFEGWYNPDYKENEDG